MDRILVTRIAVFSLLVVTTAPMFADVDYPCNPKWHTQLNQHYRNTGYDTRPEDIPECDNSLKKGWYKFIDAAGSPTQIATECPGSNTCGTSTPVWMNGSHPQVNDGIVGRRLCGMMADNETSQGCCDYQDDLFVKNCGGFYVYYLSPTYNCPSSYCAGTAKRCPVDKWSNTSLEPCRDLAPVLTTPPVVKGPNVRPNQTVDYQCQIQFGPDDPDQVFQVVWTFNNVTDPSIKPDILIGSQKVATLSGDVLQKHLDTEVGCQVSTFYIPEKNKNTYSSQTSYFGVQHVNLTGPYLRRNQSFDFECDVNTTTQDPNQQIEVLWTFDGQQDPEVEPQVITGGTPTATLDGSAIQGHFNSHIGCQARLVYEGHIMKSEFRKSNTLFAGIQVDPGKLEISDSEGQKTFTVTSTIPVVCDHFKDCCLTFSMEVDKSTVVTLKDSCQRKLCLDDWQPDQKKASFNVTVVPSRNAIGGGTREAVLSFTNVTASGTGPYIDVFNSSRPHPVQIVVRLEAGFRCSITGDPHFQGFDLKRIYDLYQTGDYVVYAVKDRDFQVQIRSWPCWAVTCVCGVAVKERNDVIKVYGCETHGDLVSAALDVPYTLSPGAVVRRSSNGRHVGILLASGSEIKIDIYGTYMNLYIQTPAYDKNKASGICGTNDGNPENDFTHPDGTVSPVCSSHGRCLPVNFTESWRVAGTASMFVASPEQVPEKPVEQYCSCSAGSQERSARSCSPRQHIQESDLSCKNCREITRQLKPSPWGQPGQPESPYTHKEVNYVDPSKQGPNDKGITESKAKEMCSSAIEKSQLYQQCKDMETLVNTAMAECLGDVLDGGTNETLPAVTSSFTNKCQMTAASNRTNYQQGSDGGMALDKQFSDHVCADECTDHGRCADNGTCVCQDGWQGDTCQIQSGKGPQITWTSGSPWCDVNQKSCQHFQFDKSNVNIHDKLKCRVQAVDSQGNTTGQPAVVDAEGDSTTRVVCPLPTTNRSAQNYTVSVTSDGTLYGNELPVYTFDSLCLNCSDVGCSSKNTGCHINNTCHKNGDSNKDDRHLVCDTSRNLTDWSPATQADRTNYQSVSELPGGTTPADAKPSGATRTGTTPVGSTGAAPTPRFMESPAAARYTSSPSTVMPMGSPMPSNTTGVTTPSRSTDETTLAGSVSPPTAGSREDSTGNIEANTTSNPAASGKMGASTTSNPAAPGKMGANTTSNTAASGKMGANTTSNPAAPRKMGANTTSNPAASGKMGANTTSNPAAPGKMGANTTSNPAAPGKMGANTTSNPAAPGKMGANTTSNPAAPGNIGANTTSNPAAPSSATTAALSRRNKRILQALEKFVERVKSVMDRLKKQ